MISINPDAHSIREIDNIRGGLLPQEKVDWQKIWLGM